MKRYIFWGLNLWTWVCARRWRSFHPRPPAFDPKNKIWKTTGDLIFWGLNIWRVFPRVAGGHFTPGLQHFIQKTTSKMKWKQRFAKHFWGLKRWTCVCSRRWWSLHPRPPAFDPLINKTAKKSENAFWKNTFERKTFDKLKWKRKNYFENQGLLWDLFGA